MGYGAFELLALLGSLGLFMYGMKIMSENIQKISGEKLRQILKSMTSNRFKGVLTGFFITSIIQSSSATTVLIVSFVNAGLLSLTESITVIMGANIGTTITAWVISIIGIKIKISVFSLPIIAFGFLLLFFNSDRYKQIGEILIGFSLLFMGLAFLKDAVPDLSSNPEFFVSLNSYTDMGYLSIMLFVGIGTLVTIIVQSSSAAMALTLIMSNSGWIPFEMSVAMILGENIGTTITANIAAIVGNIYAKRAAFSHFIFNIIGVIWILIFFYPFINFIDAYMVKTAGLSPFTNPLAIPIALSIFHTVFNVTNTLLLIFFTDKIAAFVTKSIRSRGEEDEEYKLKYIHVGMMDTVELSISQAEKETVRMAELIKKTLAKFKVLIRESSHPKRAKKLVKKIKSYESISDQMEIDIYSYLKKIAATGNLGEKSSIKLTSVLMIINNLERIADLFYQMSKDVERVLSNQNNFSENKINNIIKMLHLLDEAMDIMIKNLKKKYDNINIRPAMRVEKSINSYRDQLRREQKLKIDNNTFDPKIDGLYRGIFYLCEKIGDHIIDVSEAVSGQSEKVIRAQDQDYRKEL